MNMYLLCLPFAAVGLSVALIPILWGLREDARGATASMEAAVETSSNESDRVNELVYAA
jgi:hypothetical protein